VIPVIGYAATTAGVSAASTMVKQSPRERATRVPSLCSA
jgi:hypothetical protein